MNLKSGVGLPSKNYFSPGTKNAERQKKQLFPGFVVSGINVKWNTHGYFFLIF